MITKEKEPWLELHLSSQCNNRCTYCSIMPFVDDQERKRTIINSINKFHMKGGKNIVLSGGEPTIVKDFFEILRFCKGKFETIVLASNGRMLAYKNFVKKAIDGGITRFDISLCGPNSEIHDSITNAEGSFNQTIAGLNTLSLLNQKIFIDVVLLKKNIGHLNKMK